MAQKKIALEFDIDSVTDARALARALRSVFEASRVGGGAIYVEGFAMNPTDDWDRGDHRIQIINN